MSERVTEQLHFDNLEKTRPFSSASSYFVLALCSLLPAGLWLTQGSFRAVFADFDLEVSQVTILFLSPLTPFLALILPTAAVANEFFIADQDLHYRCDTVLIVLTIISLIFAGLAFGVPMWNLINGLQG